MQQVIIDSLYLTYSVIAPAKPTYVLVGNAKECLPTYTYVDGCDGWQVANLEECQQKCTRNEFPNTKCYTGQKCTYVLYTDIAEPWCHLADNSCVIKDAQNKNTNLYKKGMLKLGIVHTINITKSFYFAAFIWMIVDPVRTIFSKN